MKEIVVCSKKYGDRIALVDDEDYEKLYKFRWSLWARPKNNQYYAETTINKKKVFMHRFLMGFPDKKNVDHIDGNGLNNQKTNLRICTQFGNTKNRIGNQISTSKYKGVCKHRGRWLCQIHIGEEKYFLGYFDSEIDAAHRYDYEAIKYHGEFVKLNDPDFDYSKYSPPKISDRKKNRCSSIYKGVGFHKQSKKWRARIRINEQDINIGMFNSEIEAAKAYNNFVTQYGLRKELNEIN
jgi:hypothetical protein